jgi:hypothetical protein
LLFGNGNTVSAANISITSVGLTQNTARLLGRTTGGVGAIEEITVVGATLTGGVLTVTAGGGGSPGGSTGQLQTNNDGAFAGVAGAVTNTSNVLLHLNGQSTTQSVLRLQRPSGTTAPILRMDDHFGTLMVEFNSSGGWYQSQNTSIGDTNQAGVHIGQTGGSNVIVLSRGSSFSRWFTDVTTDFGGISRWRLHTGGGQGFQVERAGNGSGAFRFGFYGLDPVAQQVLPAALSGSATLADVINFLNSLRTALITSTLFS